MKRSRIAALLSRLAGSALFWAVGVVAVLEARRAEWMNSHYFNHEVDRLVFDLDHGRYGQETVFLGDSVAFQVAAALREKDPQLVAHLASNGAIQTPGQYYVLRRFMDRFDTVRHVVLMMRAPRQGNLDRRTSENYHQRNFTRLREIADFVAQTHRFDAGLRMLAYRLLPSYRCRLHLQETVLPALPQQVGWTSRRFLRLGYAGRGRSRRSATGAKRRAPRVSLSETYFRRMAAELDRAGIDLLFIPAPYSAFKAREHLPSDRIADLKTLLDELSATYEHFSYRWPPRVYPDKHFKDGTHFKRDFFPTLQEDYAPVVQEFSHRTR